MHGYGATKECFVRQFPYFTDLFRVYAPDLPGFKAPLESPYSLQDYADAVLKFIVETGEPYFNVVSHSFSARIVLKLAPCKYFKKIVFTGAAGLKPKRTAGYFLKKWGYKSVKAIFGEKAAVKFGKKAIKNGIYDMPLNNRLSFIKIVNEHLDYKLKDITCPTLIVEGKHDAETPMYMAERFHRGILSSVLVKLDGGHFVFIDDPVRFNFIVKDFLL